MFIVMGIRGQIGGISTARKDTVSPIWVDDDVIHEHLFGAQKKGERRARAQSEETQKTRSSRIQYKVPGKVVLCLRLEPECGMWHDYVVCVASISSPGADTRRADGGASETIILYLQ